MAKKIILLIDDDPTLGDIMKTRIEEDGYLCVWEHDGHAGLERMRELHPDLLLLDIVMPRMNGYEVLETIHKDPLLSPVPVIVISNSGQPVEIERILDLGVKDYIVKAHFSPEEVMEKVENVIGPGEAKGLSGVDAPIPKKPPEQTKILIIEDDVMLSDIASDRFRRDGYQVVTAVDGKEGLLAVNRERPDIVLLDIIMPGMSGFEVLKQLKEDGELKNIPVVIFSNLAQERDIARGRKLGAVDFFVKANFTPAQVVERVKDILAKL